MSASSSSLTNLTHCFSLFHQLTAESKITIPATDPQQEQPAAATETKATMSSGNREHVSFLEEVKIREVDSLDHEDEDVPAEESGRPSAETDQSEEGKSLIVFTCYINCLLSSP
jgi:hypothetical protein